MQYAILIHEPQEAFDKRGVAGEHEAYMAPYHRYMTSLREAGVLVGGEVLKGPSTATRVTVRDGVRHIQDGPVAHSHDLLGGFLIIDVANLDDALAWAARCPAAETGTVEVRPTGMETPE